MIDINALSYWFPKIEAAGLPVPKTALVKMPLDAQKLIWAGFDGEEGAPEQNQAGREFFAEIESAARAMGLPCFLRTDHTSAKHEWEKTCFISDPLQIPGHVFAIAEYSEMAGIMGLPWHTWAVRELLPTIPLGTCPRYGHMPICREFRAFVDGGALKCVHPYWPKKALEEGGADAALDYDNLCSTDISFDGLCRRDDRQLIRDLAQAAGASVGGSWSVDVLETRRGWYVTDMAVAADSFHWPSCEFAH